MNVAHLLTAKLIEQISSFLPDGFVRDCLDLENFEKGEARGRVTTRETYAGIPTRFSARGWRPGLDDGMELFALVRTAS